MSGSLRGRRIDAPDSPATRPTTDKVREAVFNALGSLGEVEGARVADLFAGSGAMGIEALSRGASECVFVERDRAALAVLRRNLETLGVGDSSRVLDGDAVALVSRIGHADIVIADPPYGFSDWATLLKGVSAEVVVLESDREPPAIEGWEVVRSKRYGRTHVTFLRAHDSTRGTVEGE